MGTKKNEPSKGKIQDFERRFVDKEKGPIKLRTRERANGCFVIYLDMYIGDGKHKCETVNIDNQALYLVPENGRNDTVNKTRNNKTWEQAKAVKAQKIIDKQNGELGFNQSAERRNMEVLAFLKKLKDEQHEANKSKPRKGSRHFAMLYKHFEAFLNGTKLTFAQLDREVILKFISFLEKSADRTQKLHGSIQKLGKTTQALIYQTFRTAMEKAMQDRIIENNPCNLLSRDEKPRRQKAHINYLTVEEVRQLIETPCDSEILKRAFLFSCSTGLRFSDVSTLKWGDIQEDAFYGQVMNIKVQKTQKVEIFPLPSLALHELPPRNNAKDEERIFPLLYGIKMSNMLQKWADDAGIKKKVRFHVARHTAATINLSLGVPIETVSKLLGHSSIAMTEIYAEVINESKKKAMNLQNKAFKFD